MPDRWVARLLWVLAAFVFLGALVAAIWWLPSELTRRPSAGVSATARLGAENAARAALVAALAVVGAAGLTARYAWQAAKLTEEGQITDRYTKAIEQLGSKELNVRIGGIYALERITRDSARGHPTVMEVLTAFIREHSREPWPPPGPGDRDQGQSARPDIQAALSVVRRRDAKHDIQPIDLVGADLRGANLISVNLRLARLTGADLTGADLSGANLIRARLIDADLRGARLAGARLGANLIGADLSRGSLADVDFTGAGLSRANLNGANFIGARLNGADLDGADLTGARWPEYAPVPEGWRLDPGSGLLERARTDSGPTEAD